MGKFVKRSCCPACDSKRLNTIYALPYEHEVLNDYLTEFYTAQNGEIDLSYVKDETYALIKCQNCELIFQEYIPNEEFMQILYSKWINPEFNKIRTNNFGFSYYRAVNQN